MESMSWREDIRDGEGEVMTEAEIAEAQSSMKIRQEEIILYFLLGADPAKLGADRTIYTPVPNSLLHPTAWDCPACHMVFGSYDSCRDHLLSEHKILDDPEKDGE